jgi:site-specific DNA recombinase
VSTAVLKQGRDACPIGRVPAGEIERAVIDQLRTILRSPEIVARTSRAAKAIDPGIGEAGVRDALHRLDPLWEELFPAEQARIVQLLVERVDVGEGDIAIRLRTAGLTSFVEELRAPSTPASSTGGEAGRRAA